MPTEYKLKRSVLDNNRIQKVAKKLIDESGQDRKLALDNLQYFKDMVQENPNDSTAKSLIVDCMKLAQQSKDKVIKVIDLMIKLEDKTSTQKTKASGSSEQNMFNALDELSDG